MILPATKRNETTVTDCETMALTESILGNAGIFLDSLILIIGFALSYLAARAYLNSKNARMLFFSVGFLFITIASLIEGTYNIQTPLMFASSISGYLFILLGFFTQKSKAKIYLNLISGILIFIILLIFIGPSPSGASNLLYAFTAILSLTIAMLFLNNYHKSKNKASLLFFTGFLILFLSEMMHLANLEVSIAHLLRFPGFLTLAYILLNEERRTSIWSDIHPVKEEQFSTKEKYHLKDNESYIVDGSSSRHAYDVFEDAIHHGKEGLCFSKLSPDRVREITNLKRTPIVWLTESEYGGGIKPRDFRQVTELSGRYIQESKNAIILVDGVEYLIQLNSFEQIYAVIEELKNMAAKSGSILIVSIDTKTLAPEENAKLRKILKSL